MPSATQFTYSTGSGLTAGTAFGTVESAIYIGGAGTSVANSSLLIGSSGIDLSAASHSAALCATGFAFAGSQTWSVAAGRVIRFGGSGVSAASGKAVSSGSDGLIDISGSGIVDANQGGASGMADAGGVTGFTGKWRVNNGATLRGDGIANVWDNSITTNWINAGNPDAFYAGDYVAFDDTSKLRLNHTPTPTNALLNFDGVSNKSYTVQHRRDLNASGWQKLVDYVALPSNVLIHLPVSLTNGANFFRLTTPQVP